MASVAGSETEALLAKLGSEDRKLFFEERERLLEGRGVQSPLLDQLCLVRVVLARLSEGHARALAVTSAAESPLQRRRGLS